MQADLYPEKGKKARVIFYIVHGGKRVVFEGKNMREVLDFLQPYKDKKLIEIFGAQNG